MAINPTARMKLTHSLEKPGSPTLVQDKRDTREWSVQPSQRTACGRVRKVPVLQLLQLSPEHPGSRIRTLTKQTLQTGISPERAHEVFWKHVNHGEDVTLSPRKARMPLTFQLLSSGDHGNRTRHDVIGIQTLSLKLSVKEEYKRGFSIRWRSSVENL
jgi:hypothetical protein